SERRGEEIEFVCCRHRRSKRTESDITKRKALSGAAPLPVRNDYELSSLVPGDRDEIFGAVLRQECPEQPDLQFRPVIQNRRCRQIIFSLDGRQVCDRRETFRERWVYIVRLPCTFIVFSAGKFQIARVPFHHRRKVTSSEHGEEGVNNVRIKSLTVLMHDPQRLTIGVGSERFGRQTIGRWLLTSEHSHRLM